MRARELVPVLLVAAVCGLLGCGGDGDPGAAFDTTAPQVATVTPAAGAVDVGLLSPLALTFSEPMDPATLGGLVVADGAQDLLFVADYDAASRTLTALPVGCWTPDASLTLGLADATDLAGNVLAPFTAGFDTGDDACANLADRFEPDDDTASAADVAIDLYPALSTCGDDEDFYRITLTDTLKVSARTTIASAGNVTWNIHWVREDMAQYATRSTSIVDGETVDFPFTFYPGTYYLQLYGPVAGDPVLYDLTFATADPCRDDVYEDNDFQDEAAAVEPGLHEGLTACYLDADWYAFPVTDGQTIHFGVEHGGPTGTRLRRLRILEPGGLDVVQVFTVEPDAAVSLTATADGEAQVMVMFWDDAIEYSMTIGVEGP